MVGEGRPSLSPDDIREVLRNSYAIENVDSVEPLVSFHDQNFLVRTKTGRKLLLKIINWKDSENRELHDELNKLMSDLSESVCCPVPLNTVRGTQMTEFKAQFDSEEKTCLVRLFDYIPGGVLEKGKITRQQSSGWGKLVGEIHKVFERKKEYPIIRNRNTLFSWINTPQVRGYLDSLDSPEDRALIQDIVMEYEDKVLPKLLTYKREILHGDLNDANILCGLDGSVNAVLDLFECQGGPFICDLAVALAYLVIALPSLENDLDDYLREAANAYSACMPNVLSDFGDIELFVVMVCGRLAQSVTLGLAAYKTTGDTYCANTQATGWDAARRIFRQRKNFEHVFGNAFRISA